jgi:hypothetical protein
MTKAKPYFVDYIDGVGQVILDLQEDSESVCEYDEAKNGM